MPPTAELLPLDAQRRQMLQHLVFLKRTRHRELARLRIIRHLATSDR